MSLPRADVPLEGASLPAKGACRGRLPSWRAAALIVGASAALWVPIILGLRLLLG
jgi:hypothetical protein